MKMKNRGIIRWFAVFGTVISMGMLTSGTASAQFGGMRSTWFPQNNPSSLSPWLEMQRISSPDLDSYNQFVRPRLEMEQLLMAQRREMNRQQERQKMMQKDLSQALNFQQNQDYQLQIEATATGKGTTYGNYLNFYPRKK